MKLSHAKAKVAQSEQPITFIVRDAADQPYLGADGNPTTFSVKGSESKVFRDKQKEFLERQQANGERMITATQARLDLVELYACALTAWTGVEEEDGSPKAMTLENVGEILLETPHILEQVVRHVNKHSAFFVNSSPS